MILSRKKSRSANTQEPLFHIVKKSNITLPEKMLIYAVAIIVGLVLSAVLCGIFSGHSPMEFIPSVLSGAFGTKRTTWLLFREMSWLAGISAALVPAFKMRFWNLGGNGQILMSALATVACMYYLGGKMPDGILLVIMFFAGVAAGIIWAFIPAIFRALFNTNETLFTLMMNYIASGLVSMFITIWAKGGSGKLNPIPYGNMPAIADNPYILSIIFFTLLNLFMYVYLRYSKHGYEISVVGESFNTAKYIGIDVKKVIIRTMILSGAIAGLVGFFLASSFEHPIAVSSA